MDIFKIVQKVNSDDLNKDISLDFKSKNLNLWEDIFNDLKYKSVFFSKDFIDYQFIYNKYFEKEVVDLSVIIFFKQKPIGLLPFFYLKNKNMISFFDKGIPSPSFTNEFEEKDEIIVLNKLIICFQKILKIISQKELIFFQHGPIDKSGINNSKFNQSNKYIFKKNYDLYLNLKPNFENIKKNFRKSYVNIINKKLIDKIEIFDPKISNPKIWEDFKELHFKVAKKKTRNDDSWKKQLDNLFKKKAIFFYCVEKNKLIGGSLFDITPDEAYYSVGVYNDTAKKKYASHYIQNTAINYFKSKKISWYFLGKYFSKLENNISQKEISIAFFKKGFSSDIVENNKFKI